jgi:hypothetical protein
MPAELIERLEYRIRVGRIDARDFSALLVAEEESVIVFEAGDETDR